MSSSRSGTARASRRPRAASARSSRRSLADAACDDQPVQLSAREARERQAVLSRQLAGDRLHLGDLFRGENGADGPRVLDQQGRRDAAHESACASARPRPAPCRAGRRSPGSSDRQPHTRPSSPAAPPCAGACNKRPAARAPHAQRSPSRSHKGSCPPPPQRSSERPRLLLLKLDRTYGREHLATSATCVTHRRKSTDRTP
jgi:hypothetical protein